MKPERHLWDEGSTHRAVGGKEYDEVWGYAEQLEAELAMYERDETFASLAIQLAQLEAENEALGLYAEFIVEKDYGAEYVEWYALLTGEKSK